jgi:hypothetical protein
MSVSSDAPCADPKFITPLKRSPEFRALRPRLAGPAPHPVYDSWLDDGFHFFVFVLASDGDTGSVTDRSSFAVFAMHPDSPEPVSAIAVVPDESGAAAEITNLRPPGGSYVAPLPFSEQSSAGGPMTPDSPEP